MDKMRQLKILERLIAAVKQPGALVLSAGAALLLLSSAPAGAEVRFGPNVYIGGYDFSHRRYRSVTIRRVKRLSGPPGCRIIPHGRYRRGDGTVDRGPVETCNLPARR